MCKRTTTVCSQTACKRIFEFWVGGKMTADQEIGLLYVLFLKASFWTISTKRLLKVNEANTNLSPHPKEWISNAVLSLILHCGIPSGFLSKSWCGTSTHGFLASLKTYCELNHKGIHPTLNYAAKYCCSTNSRSVIQISETL